MNIRLQNALVLSNCTCFMGIPFPADSSGRRNGMNAAASLLLQVLAASIGERSAASMVGF
jgi:hypothetical protein